jgi:hypothetical protein
MTNSRSRRGTGGWGRLLLIVLILGGAVIAIFATSYRWAFYLGGTFHIIPWWQGVGQAHTKSGDYILYLRVEPETLGLKTHLSTNLTGMGQICSPKGEDIVLTLGGGMRRNLNVSTDGEKISLYVHRLNVPRRPTNNPPELKFAGQWQNPKLVMDDQGTIAQAFGADGSVLSGKERHHSHATEAIPITFSPGSIRDYKNACAAMRR